MTTREELEQRIATINAELVSMKETLARLPEESYTHGDRFQQEHEQTTVYPVPTYVLTRLWNSDLILVDVHTGRQWKNRVATTDRFKSRFSFSLDERIQERIQITKYDFERMFGGFSFREEKRVHWKRVYSIEWDKSERKCTL